MKLNKRITNSGYTAISSVLVIASVVLTIGVGVSLISINELQNAFGANKNYAALDSIDSCVEDALLRLNNFNNIPTSFPIPSGTCNILVNSHTGNDWDITVSGEFSNYAKSIRLLVSRTNTIIINSWLEN